MLSECRKLWWTFVRWNLRKITQSNRTQISRKSYISFDAFKIFLRTLNLVVGLLSTYSLLICPLFLTDSHRCLKWLDLLASMTIKSIACDCSEIVLNHTRISAYLCSTLEEIALNKKLKRKKIVLAGWKMQDWNTSLYDLCLVPR